MRAKTHAQRLMKLQHKLFGKKVGAKSLPRFILFASVFGFIGLFTLLYNFAASPAITYYVATNGSDTNPGTQTQPFQTISKAVSTATGGDTILVNSGVYHEQVNILKSSLTLRGVGPTKPVIDGDNVRGAGINYGSNHLGDETVDNFELRNFYTANTASRATGIVGYEVYSSVFENNDIHDAHGGPGVNGMGIVLGTNSAPYVGQNDKILNNRIHDIGPGGESWGIWLLYTQNMTIDGNSIYMVRKEGVRDWHGLSNTITNNRAFLNWIGIEIETAQKDYIANNYSYNNVFGFSEKHNAGKDSGTATCPIQPDTYDKDVSGNVDYSNWSRFWHNTAYHNTGTGFALGQSGPQGDYIAIEDNIFAGNGNNGVWNWPSTTCGHVILDGNVYSRLAPPNHPYWDYYAGWNSPPSDLSQTVTDINNLLYNGGKTTADGWGWAGWFVAGGPEPKINFEQHGQDFNMTFKDPGHADLDYTTAPPNAGLSLDDSYGSQLGARNVPAETVQWTEYPMTAIAASAGGISSNFGSAARTTDDTDNTYWWSSGAPNANTNQWITYDLGQARTFQQFVVSVFSQYDSRFVKNYSFQVSNDDQTWTTVLAGTNPDDEGSSYKYELPQPVTARYIKFNMVNNFGGAYLILPDVQVGLLQNANTAPITIVGDLNGDGHVNIFDLSLLLAKWNKADAAADLNHDGIVNIFDLSLLLGNYGI